ncbi:hypothetical protein IAT38_006908 [Cryptococcus sp. DSM 104549]
MRLPRHSSIFCLLVTLSLLPPIILVIALVGYLNESMRICLPVSLSKLSTTAHQHLSCQAIRPSKFTPGSAGIMSDATVPSGGAETGGVKEGRLAGFLLSQKDLFLEDLKAGKGKGWTVVMGNEAGDLDSLASSIAYSQLSSTLEATRAIPLTLTPQKYMTLRPENLLAFQNASLPLNALLHAEQLPVPPSSLADLGVTFALVDHNKLLPDFGPGEVVAVIDHHDDEGAHESAPLRKIRVPTGSCASLVAAQFKAAWQASVERGSPVPSELATLLLSAILIDTGSLKEGGKAMPVDYDSAAFLYGISTLPQIGAAAGFSTDPEDSPVPAALRTYGANLLETKMNVSTLSTYELLMRDYKEYALPTLSTAWPTLKVGLSTVPLGLKPWLEKEKDGWDSLFAGVSEYMAEKTLDIEGILTSFRSETKGKHKRQLALIVRSGGVIKSPQDAERILEELAKGLEESGALLGLEEWKKGDKFKNLVGKRGVDVEHGEGGRFVKVWVQNNTKSTRKQVAPLLRDLIAKLQ